MIRIKRPRCGPPCLHGPASAAAAEQARARLYYQRGATAAYPFTVYRRPEVKLALEAISHQKCAYCEANHGATADGAVEHYRPKGAIPNEPHPGDWWLAATWSNLLPTCQLCNESRGHVIVDPTMTMAEAARSHRAALNLQTAGKASQFPIRGRRRNPSALALAAEDALLIDPTRRDPLNHISFPPETGVSLATPIQTPQGADPYGLATINVTALNRFDAVHARSTVLMQLRPLVLSLAKALDAADEAEKAGNRLAQAQANEWVTDTIAAINARADPKSPYSAVAVWLLKRLDTWLLNERTHGVKFEIPAIEGL